MIVTPLPYGRMCNRLLLATHFICHVEKHGGSYLHLAFIDYARYFENTRRSGVVFYRSTRSDAEGSRRKLFGVRSVMFTFDRHGGDLHIDTDESFLTQERETRVLFTCGWAFRDRTATVECADAARSFFKPTQKHADAVARFIDAKRKGCDTLVGVHIRQTDYAKFLGGKFLFGPEEYRRCMESVAAFEKGRVRFLVASDAPVDHTAFGGLDVVATPGHPLRDNLALSACDLILGPPSTYNQWASFYGKVPRFVIREPGIQVKRDAFSVALI